MTRRALWQRAAIGLALNFALCTLPFVMNTIPVMWHALNFTLGGPS